MNSYDVAIIGRGLTAMSAARHLVRLGIRRTCVIAPPRTPSNCASLHMAFASATLQDNVTRPVHNLGIEKAKELLRLVRSGFLELQELLHEWKIPSASGQVYRLSQSDHESREMAIATDWFIKNGFPAELILQPKFLAKCQTAQRDGASAVSFPSALLLNQLENHVKITSIPHEVRRIQSRGDGLLIQTSSGDKISAEMAVLACHQSLRELVPELSSAVVNHADQVVEFKIRSGRMPTVAGDLLLVEHGQFWISHSFKQTIFAGGARFLRKWGGIEAKEAPVLNAVSEAIRKKIEPLFDIQLSDPIAANGVIELHACDEVPIIGPMFGNSRLLIATGYMGSGATMGLAAGRGLAEFVQYGRSKTVGELFLPARLRSLTESM